MIAIGIRIRVRVRVGVNQTVETAVDTPTGKQSVVSLTKVLTKSYPSHSSRKYRYRKAGELVFVPVLSQRTDTNPQAISIIDIGRHEVMCAYLYSCTVQYSTVQV